MIQIQETRCSAELRKDCNLKKTCQLRHLNEEAGKDLEYYTRKFNRSTSTPGEPSLGRSSMIFPVSNFSKVSVKGDGHCIIHSVFSLLQERGVQIPSKKELLDDLKLAFLADIDSYAPFINGCETDPIAELEAYVNDAKYGSGIVDLIVPLIANVLKIGIVVVLLDSRKVNYVTSDNLKFPSPQLCVVEPLYLLKSGSHYDPLHGPLPNISKDKPISVGQSTRSNSRRKSLSASLDTIIECEELLGPVPASTDLEAACASSESVSNDLDPVRILASLCAHAPDYEVRDCLRKYSTEFSLKRQKSTFNSVTKSVLIKTAEYLHISTGKLNKPDIIHLLICKIQNLLPDICQICKTSYVCNINDPPFLPCSLCGQEVHRDCLLAKLGLTSVDGANIDKLINPFELPGFHYFCGECEKATIPDFEKNSSLVKQSCTPNDKTLDLCNSSDALECSEVSHATSVNSESSENINCVRSEVVPNDFDCSSGCSNNDNIISQSSKTDHKRVSFPVPTNGMSSHSSSDHNIDVQHSSNLQTFLPVKQVQDKPKTKICVHFKRNQCKHGLKGNDCSFLHPERCKKLLEHGTSSTEGCNLGKKCQFFHPKMCPSSISKRVCFDDKCQFTHVKGTKRKASQTHGVNSEKLVKSHLGKQQVPSKTARIPKEHQNLEKSACEKNKSPSESSFLEVVSLLKKELLETIETKIAKSLPQIPSYNPRQNPSIQHFHPFHYNPPFHNPPRLYQTPPFHQPPPFHPYPILPHQIVPGYQTFLPQFPPQFPPMRDLQPHQ